MRRGYAAYQAFYDVLPPAYKECEPLLERPMTEDPAGQSFARSRAAVAAELATSMRAERVAAMVYPTMPFNASRAVDDWPDVRTPLGYGNALGPPEVSVPAGYGASISTNEKNSRLFPAKCARRFRRFSPRARAPR